MTYVRGGHNDYIHKFTAEQLETMRRMFEAGDSLQDIAVALGLSASAYKTIDRRCKAFGIEAKARRGASIAVRRG